MVHFIIIDYIDFFWSIRWGYLWGKFRPLRQLQSETGESLAKNYKSLTTTKYFILLSFFGSLSRHFKVHRVDTWLYWGFSGVRGEVICEKLNHWGRYGLKQGNPLQNFKNQSQLPNFFIIIFGLIISRSTKLIFGYIEVFKVRGGVLWGEVSTIQEATAWNRGIPWKKLKTTHNYQKLFCIIIFGSLYHHSKVHRVDIWLYWGLSVLLGEILWGGVLTIESDMAWNRGTRCKILKPLTTT